LWFFHGVCKQLFAKFLDYLSELIINYLKR
jgi:hypothetical protein